MTFAPENGSPFWSTMTPEITLPRVMRSVMPAIRCASARTSAVPGRFGRLGSVGDGHVALLVRRQHVTSGWQRHETESPAIVGHHRARDLPIRRDDRDAHAAQRAGVGIIADDGAVDDGGAGLDGFGRVSARGLSDGRSRRR